MQCKYIPISDSVGLSKNYKLNLKYGIIHKSCGHIFEYFTPSPQMAKHDNFYTLQVSHNCTEQLCADDGSYYLTPTTM